MNESLSPNLTSTVAAAAVSAHTLRLALTLTHLFLVCVGTVNLLVILLILTRPRYMRSITNVYIIGLCMADFIYLVNLTLVAATQLRDKSWMFGSVLCTLYHGSETTGKYASVLFVVLLAADRYCAMCKANWCARYRNYQTAIIASIVAWAIALIFSLPMYMYANDIYTKFKPNGEPIVFCIAKWPSPVSARTYIAISSICLFAAPMVLIIFCYYHIFNKLREAVNGSKRLQRAASTRAPYHRVTRLVLWVVIFHTICWSPFWLFNLFSSVLRLRITSQFERIVVNILHLFPYVNCALNPLLYAFHAENFRLALRSLFGCSLPPDKIEDDIVKNNNHNSTALHKNSNYVTAAIMLPVEGETNYTIIKDKSLLAQPDLGTNRSLSDSSTPTALSARKEALNSVIHGKMTTSHSSQLRFGERPHGLPQPSTWRKYSELEPRPDENNKFSSSSTPLLEEDHHIFNNVTKPTLLLLNEIPYEFDGDTNL